MTPNNRTVLAAQFRKAYDALAEREVKFRALPENDRPAIGNSEIVSQSAKSLPHAKRLSEQLTAELERTWHEKQSPSLET